MTDVLTPEQRKLNMSRIRSSNTTPELRIRKLLYARGVRGYRIHYNLPGKPDIVFTKKRLVIFIDGCFWHKCPVCFKLPKTRTIFWTDKINKNVIRDNNSNVKLISKGWKVLRFWEHEVKLSPENVVNEIMSYLNRY